MIILKDILGTVVIFFAFILMASPLLAVFCYLCSFFAKYHGLKYKSTFFLIIAIFLTIVSACIYSMYGKYILLFLGLR